MTETNRQAQPILPSQIIAAVEDARAHADPSLANWVRSALATGRTPYDVVRQLVADGRPLEIATLLVGLAIKGLALAPASHSRANVVADPDADTRHAERHAIVHAGTTVRTLLTIGRGGMEFALYDGLVTDAEIDHLKSLASTRLKKSTVLGDNFSNADSDARTSEDTFLEVGCDPVVAALEARISAVTGIPVERGEGLQILHYGTTQEYKPHFDFFDPASQQEHAIMAGPGNRVGTMILYLGEVERGGSTYFPKLDLAVHPQRGQAVWFGYLHGGLLDERSQHAGMPILEGEKWIATKWFRERRFDNGSVPAASP